MQMIRHQAGREYRQMQSRLGAGDQGEELLVVRSLVKDARRLVGAIEDVVAVAADNGARSARHAPKPVQACGGARMPYLAGTGIFSQVGRGTEPRPHLLANQECPD
jgi:hypothetical protein